MSNVRSLDFQRASMRQMQSYLSQVDREITAQKEWNDWQTEYMDNIEVHLSEVLTACEQMNQEIYRLNKLITKLVGENESR